MTPEDIVTLIGPEFYARKWRSLPWYSKLYWTMKGYAPGGRKGAPPIQ